jgi:hypothetical protein
MMRTSNKTRTPPDYENWPRQKFDCHCTLTSDLAENAWSSLMFRIVCEILYLISSDTTSQEQDTPKGKRMHLLIVINLSPYTGTLHHAVFLPRIFLQKSLRMRIRFGYSFFRQRKDGMIQEMIYQCQKLYL